MKFGKQFETQQVPEWKYVYCDYRQLKHLVKTIEKQKARHVERRPSRRISTFRRMLSGLHGHHSTHEDDEEMILIRPVEDGVNKIEFETAFLGLGGTYDDLERSFFRLLDTELGKVNTFYQSKEKELITQAGLLDKQMETLISIKETAQQGSSKMGSSGGGQLQSVNEEESVSKHVRVEIPVTNPADALASIIGDLASKSLFNLNLRRVNKAEDMVQEAFIQFYHALCLLKNYSSLNIIAFSKALKKYDKVTGRSLSKSYLRAVEGSYIARSDKIQRLMDKVELLFTNYFASSDHHSAMQKLRPFASRDRHRITFLLGSFFGGSVSLLVALIMTIRLENLYGDPDAPQYMNAVFPIFSLLAAVLLHIYMYGLNVYLWRRTGVNHSFILGLNRSNELKFRDIFLLATSLNTFALFGMTLHLQLTAGRKCCSGIKEAIPLAVLLVPCVLLLIPFRILYRSTRLFFLTCLFHCILAPFYKVVITDFLLGDQLTSQVTALRDLEYVLCYYSSGFFKRRNSKGCTDNALFKSLGYVMVLLPYWSRMMQCLRRWYDEKDKMQFYNALKYLSAILAVASRTAYTSQRNSILRLVLTIILSLTATIVATYWDLVHDWGLLSKKSLNPWLRDKLMLPYKSFYYIAMVTNIVLRFAWLQTLIDIQIQNINPKAMSLMVACLEVIRRGQWNFYRLENEHLNNVGKFRAVKSVPLPFSN